MLKLCELTGLSPADAMEILGYIMGFFIASVFVGNMVTWIFKETLALLVGLVCTLDMLKLCELTGLSPADVMEISGYITGFFIASVFVGNMVTWIFKETLALLVGLVCTLSNIVRRYIEKKRLR